MKANPSLAVAPEFAGSGSDADGDGDREASGTRGPSSAQGAHFLELISDRLTATEELMRQQVTSEILFIEEASGHIFNGGGKRVRPALLLLSSRMLGTESVEDVTYAAVVEMIHTATLVHDDIIDDSRLRRGRTTVHNIWDNSQAVLLGDWLYTTSMKMALSHDRLDVVRELCDATLRMTEGELLVLQRLGASDVSRDEYFDIIERKTANLFASACSIPAIHSGVEADLKALEQYGRSLGLCFQLVDDLLDFTESEAGLGKPVLSDLRGGKLTLPLILLMPRLDDRQRSLIETVLEDRDFGRVEPDQILELVSGSGVVDEVREMAGSCALAAKNALERFPAGEARDALEFAPEFVLNRRS